ncbi:MAG: glucose-6-phosphate isomerase [Deltaproteobacteria bacterium]|nr:glucose-6-phosphate isomerase [Deltaproteobacteria bacterium]
MEEINPIGLVLDVSRAYSSHIGENGLNKQDIDTLAPRISDVMAKLAGEREVGVVDFYGLPGDDEIIQKTLQMASSISGRFDNLVVLGIGGSSLGPRALVRCLSSGLSNLRPPEKRGRRPRVFFLDNVDPDSISDLLDILPLSRTAFNVISKSGSTVETLAQFLVIRDKLELLLGNNSSEHIVITTDPENGALRDIAGKKGYSTLDVPPNVGGRYSIFSPVGLFPAAVAGTDIEMLMQGASEMEKACWNDDVRSNPAALLASTLYLLDRKKGAHIHVFMSYSDAMESVCRWQRQLWAESLGKTTSVEGKDVTVGPTPIAALGTPDQHSMLQLCLEGPKDKVLVFLTSRSLNSDVEIPSFPGEPLFETLGGESFSRLLRIEKKATALALEDSGRPSIEIELPVLAARPLGALFMLLEASTAIAGGLYGINPFDQPAVEKIKQYTWGLIGRKGFEEYREKANAEPKPESWQTIRL